MSTESVIQFLQEAGQDPTVTQQLQLATDQPSFVNKVLELGHQKGYSFSSSDVSTSLDSLATQVQSQASADGELSEDELEAVAGGGDKIWVSNHKPKVFISKQGFSSRIRW